MRSPLLLVLFLFSGLFVSAQLDTAAHGTIRVSKPDIKAFVLVTVEYAVYLNKSDAPRLGKIKGSQLKYIKSKDLRSFGQNEENPMPLIDKSYYSKSRPVIIRKTDMPYDSVPITRMGDSLVELLDYLKENIHYSYKFKEAPAIDTVQLRVMIDKRGKYHYLFAGRQDSLSRTGPKCMEGLTLVHKWQPAHVFRMKDGKNKDPKRIKAYSEILLTIVLTTEDLGDTDEVSKKQEPGTGQ
jgi:hypothetical protein